MISPHIKAVGRLDSINNDSEGRTLARGQKKKKKKIHAHCVYGKIGQWKTAG